MAIAVSCSSCPAKLNVAESAAGKTVRCPKCGKAVAVQAFFDHFELIK